MIDFFITKKQIAWEICIYVDKVTPNFLIGDKIIVKK